MKNVFCPTIMQAGIRWTRRICAVISSFYISVQYGIRLDTRLDWSVQINLENSVGNEKITFFSVLLVYSVHYFLDLHFGDSFFTLLQVVSWLQQTHKRIWRLSHSAGLSIADQFVCAMKILDTMRIVSGTSGYQSIDQEFPSIPQSAIEETFEVEPVRFIPLETPCSWSGWTFTWFQPVITLGRRKVIKKDDMLRLPPCLTSKEVLASFMRCWAFESLRTTMIASEHSFTIATVKKPKLWRVLHTMIQKEFWFAGICRFANDALLVSDCIFCSEVTVSITFITDQYLQRLGPLFLITFRWEALSKIAEYESDWSMSLARTQIDDIFYW